MYSRKHCISSNARMNMIISIHKSTIWIENVKKYLLENYKSFVSQHDYFGTYSYYQARTCKTLCILYLYNMHV